MNYLVLGSAGQIGNGLTEFLRGNGHNVIEFDIKNNISEDLRQKNVLEKYINNSDFVMFLAFDVGGSRYLKKYQNTYEFIDNNIKIIENTFEILKKYNKPFIFASSQMSNMLNSPYGVCKLVGELYTKTLNGIIVKFWNVYGYENDYEKSHVITDFILKGKNGSIEMLTNGEEERQFLYVEDCSEALMILSENYDKIDREKELHITSFEWIKIKDIANVISEIIPCKVLPSINIDDVQNNKKNTPNPYILEFWKPKTKIYDGINKIYKKML